MLELLLLFVPLLPVSLFFNYVSCDTFTLFDTQLSYLSNLYYLVDCTPQTHITVAGLADQKRARTGNILGIAGVSFGLAATAADMSLAGAAHVAFQQVGLLGGLGGAVGATLASQVGPTELPQTVAVFHSLVGE